MRLAQAIDCTLLYVNFLQIFSNRRRDNISERKKKATTQKKLNIICRFVCVHIEENYACGRNVCATACLRLQRLICMHEQIRNINIISGDKKMHPRLLRARAEVTTRHSANVNVLILLLLLCERHCTPVVVCACIWAAALRPLFLASLLSFAFIYWTFFSPRWYRELVALDRLCRWYDLIAYKIVEKRYQWNSRRIEIKHEHHVPNCAYLRVGGWAK